MGQDGQPNTAETGVPLSADPAIQSADTSSAPSVASLTRALVSWVRLQPRDQRDRNERGRLTNGRSIIPTMNNAPISSSRSLYVNTSASRCTALLSILSAARLGSPEISPS